MGRPAVLLAGGSANPYSELAQRLSCWGAQCNFANSWEEVCKLLDERSFDLVICEANLPGGSAL
jgi:PleD family two-component response regulator